jgi:hypothetical protein
MKRVIKLTESDLEMIVKRVLNEQLANVVNTPKKIQQKLIDLGYDLGTSGPNKDGVDGYIGSRTRNAIKDFQTKNNIKPTGVLDQTTRNKLFLANKVSKQVGFNMFGKPPQNVKIKKTPTKGGEFETNKPSSTSTCIGLPKNMCSQISSKNAVALGSGEEAQCAAYVTKCLTQYDKDFKTGNAWKSASWLAGGGGTERFNLFKTNVNWNEVWKGLKDNKITKSDCMKFYGKQGSDAGTVMPKSSAILNLSKDNAPDSSSANWGSLKPGDVVGLIHNGTTNKGRAFCERMVDDLKLDDKGDFKQNPFTFNTHVGFVTAIKDGIPIIAHNVGNSFHTKGNYSAVPVTQMLSKGSPDRIVWAYSDPQVESSVQNSLKSEPEYNRPNYNRNKVG